MATKAAFKRSTNGTLPQLTKECVAMQKEPPPFVWAAPDEKNILHWNYIICGPPDSPYVGGEYFGVIMFPAEYPFKPPGIKMLTPSGRFQPDKKICFSMSDFHPGSWNPAWSVATILTGLLSFMLSDEMTTGSVTTSNVDKRAYAVKSHAWNIQNKKFRDAFPDYCDVVMKDLPNMAEKELGVANKSPPPLSPPLASATSSQLCTPMSSAASTPLSATPSRVSGFYNDPGDTNVLSNPVPNSKDKGLIDATQAGSHGAWPWGQLLWSRWYWGIFIAVALAVSSRLTGGS